MIPQVLATIAQLFTDTERGKVFGIYGFTLGFGAAVGFGLGGWLLGANLGGLGWRIVFFVNGPVGIALVIGALAMVNGTSRQRLIAKHTGERGHAFLRPSRRLIRGGRRKAPGAFSSRGARPICGGMISDRGRLQKPSADSPPWKRRLPLQLARTCPVAAG
jgi:MFS family permease